ncbi:cation:proton antiporter [Fluviibacterium sp. S390]|uniref:cation:proton antiporter n=1 Tax=Fluviibacterium sp. S390 TaxID=3415139 RepID=UPI003C7B105E
MGLILLCLVTAAYCMFGKRLEQTMVTGPMIFIALGVVLNQAGLYDAVYGEEALHVVAELALILLLFLDAAQTNLRVLARSHQWPVRMLLLGLPLAWLLGAGAIHLILPDWPLIFALLMAAILTPTDAALGQAVVSNPDVPERPRRALTVESGLNDGLALPLILLLASIAGSIVTHDARDWAVFGLKQLTLGPLAGIAIGWLGGRVLIWAKNTHATSKAYEGIGAIALATGTYLLADLIGGNGFIAAFTGGLVFGHVVKDRCHFVYEFTENEGQMLAWGAFFLLGVTLVPDALPHLGLGELAVILASLFITRPLAIWLSLAGTDAAPMTKVFFGWFGPRGLATALFAFTVMPDIGAEWGERILYLAINTVWISALLHGLTAVPAARAYAARLSELTPKAELAPIKASAKPLRTRNLPPRNAPRSGDDP